MMEPSKITNATGMKANLTGDMSGAERKFTLAAQKIKVDFFVAKEKIGFVKFTRLTDATYVFELNIKGKKVGLSYTIPQEGVDDSEY